MTTRIPRGLKSTRREVERYLDENQIPYLKVKDSLNLVMLKNSPTSHYCTIEFFKIDDEWFGKHKPFTFERIVSRRVYQIKSLIDKYLANDR